MLIFWGKTGKENDRLGEERKGYSDREDEERLKGQEKKENRKNLHFILNNVLSKE